MDKLSRIRESRANLKESELVGRVADSTEVRMELMAKVHSGEITLEKAQSELKKIKRNAKKNGQVTRSQAYAGK